jgi:IS30 family transposase
MRWSPEIISHELSENGIKFNHTSIYTVIKQHRPEWRKWLVHRGKKVRHKASTDKILNRVSIEKRPEIVDLRRRFGDWEADTVVSCRGGKSVWQCLSSESRVSIASLKCKIKAQGKCSQRPSER